MEQQTTYRCCPGWSRQDNEPGCLHCKLQFFLSNCLSLEVMVLLCFRLQSHHACHVLGIFRKHHNFRASLWTENLHMTCAKMHRKLFCYAFLMIGQDSRSVELLLCVLSLYLKDSLLKASQLHLDFLLPFPFAPFPYHQIGNPQLIQKSGGKSLY